jgi:aldehyde:ferredoxin oxidoreductase
MYGVNGRVLQVDLTKGSIREEKIPEEIYRKYLTGYGLGAYILNRDMKPGADPLGEENILGITTGVFNSHSVPLGGRFQVVAKSPITGGWGDADCGGKFGPELKNSGYDAVFIRGISPKPVYLKITDGRASIEDASGLWGKDAYATEDELKKIEPRGQALVIGVPGEKKLMVASLMNDYGRAAGRSGLGAVMGSKKLKGLIVRGKPTFKPFDQAMLMETIKEIQIEFRKNIDLARPWQLYGTTAGTESSHLNGDTPIKNWAGVGIIDYGADNARKISGEEIARDKLKSYGCAQCTLACGGHIRRKTRFGEIEGHRLEYEGTGSFGGLNLNTDLDAMAMAFEMCNRAGMDIISVGAVIAFANECFERGIITEKDVGFKIGFGDADAMVRLTELIGRGEGIGSVLGMGAKYAAQKFGKGSEKFAMQVGGQDLPMHDPRLLPSLATTYIADPTPGRHTAGGLGFDEGGTMTLPFQYSLPREKIDRYSYHGKGKMQALSVYGMQVLNATGMCLFSTSVWPNSYPYYKLFKAIMGWDVSEEEIMAMGKRIQLLRHLFNYREGINPRKIVPPSRMVGEPPLTAGPTANVTVDYRSMVDEYLQEVGIDSDGRPSPEVMKDLSVEI